MPNKDNEAVFRKAYIYLLDSTLGDSFILLAPKGSKIKVIYQIRILSCYYLRISIRLASRRKKINNRNVNDHSDDPP